MTKLSFAAVAATAMFVAGAAQADVVTFASYQQAQTGLKSLAYTNCSDAGATGMNGVTACNNGATGHLAANGDPLVNFQFANPATDVNGNSVDIPLSLQNSTAHIWLDATTTSNAYTTLNSAQQLVYHQLFETGSLGFARDGDGANLLTITFGNMELSGRGGSASTLASTDTSTITLTSDFFDFSNVVAADFAFSLSAVIQNLAIGNNGAIRSFLASSTGTFDSDPAPTFVPEPGMLGLFGFGAIALGFARRRK